MTKNKTNISWTFLLEDPIRAAALEAQGWVHITTDDMRNLYPGSPDPRLMIKFDTPECRPDIFKEKGLSLWPVGHGSFVVVKSLTPYIAIDAQKIRKLPVERMRTKTTIMSVHGVDGDRCNSESDLMRMLNDSGTIRNIHDADASEISFCLSRKFTQTTPMPVTFQTPQGPAAFVSENVRLECDAQHESDQMITTMELKIISARKGFEGITGVHARQVVFGHHSIQTRLAELGSDKQLDSYIMLAQKPSKKSPNWEIAVLAVDVDPARVDNPWFVDWERSYRLIHNRTTETFAKTFARKRPKRNLSDLRRFTHNEKAAFPQWNRLDVLLQVMTDLGKQGAADFLDELSLRVKRNMRDGKIVQLPKNYADDVPEIGMNLLLEGFGHKDTWGPRQVRYLVDALDWLGMIEAYDGTDNTVKPSVRCMTMAHCQPSVQTQQLWNILMSSPIMNALAWDLPITMDMRKAEGLEQDSTFERRVDGARKWIANVRAKMTRRRDKGFTLQEPITNVA